MHGTYFAVVFFAAKCAFCLDLPGFQKHESKNAEKLLGFVHTFLARRMLSNRHVITEWARMLW